MRHALLVSLLGLGVAASAAGAQQTPVLVSTAWLTDHLSDPSLVILHVGSEASYAGGHIPGARVIPTASFAPEVNGLSTEMPETAALETALEGLGISDNSRIIIYSGTNPPTLAARLYVTLNQFGLGAQTSLLNGTLITWRSEARVMSTDVPPAKQGSVTLKPQTNVLADLQTVSARVADKGSTIIDSRDPQFYTGESQNMQRAARPGRIPTATNVVYSSLVADTGLWLDPQALAAKFAAAGVATGKPVITYCHVGQQASVVFVAAKLAGYDVRMFDGSYEEWSKTPSVAVETGKPNP